MRKLKTNWIWKRQSTLGSINAQLGSAGKSIADSATVQAYKGQLADLESRKASLCW